MSVYEHSLHLAFSHVVILARGPELTRALTVLAATDDRHVNGSSFAVTVDTDTGNVKLWLSAASLNRLTADEEFNRYVPAWISSPSSEHRGW